jgi:hypothetical protein
MRRILIVTAIAVVAFITASPASDVQYAKSTVASAADATFVPAPMPTGAEGDLIAYGKNIIQNTHKYAGKYAVANMSCEACHNSAGTKAHAGSLVGVYAKFPQYNARSKRFIALQDRLAECFFYSMNGTTPPFDSREMIALTAYIAYISRGTVVGSRIRSVQHAVRFAAEILKQTAGLRRQGLTWASGDPFIASVESAQPYWLLRAVGGTLMFLSHLIFAFNVWSMIGRPRAIAVPAPSVAVGA